MAEEAKQEKGYQMANDNLCSTKARVALISPPPHPAPYVSGAVGWGCGETEDCGEVKGDIVLTGLLTMLQA